MADNRPRPVEDRLKDLEALVADHISGTHHRRLMESWNVPNSLTDLVITVKSDQE